MLLFCVRLALLVETRRFITHRLFCAVNFVCVPQRSGDGNYFSSFDIAVEWLKCVDMRQEKINYVVSVEVIMRQDLISLSTHLRRRCSERP